MSPVQVLSSWTGAGALDSQTHPSFTSTWVGFESHRTLQSLEKRGKVAGTGMRSEDRAQGPAPV